MAVVERLERYNQIDHAIRPYIESDERAAPNERRQREKRR
jgi:hypothetical protein